ncbi:MAG: DUF4178 domain-containing protein [Janthinobacterium lividum]
MDIACPSCGAAIPFRSSVSVYAVCASCGSTVLRSDRDVHAIGSVADLPAEMTPLQVGTELEWQGARYTLAGRLRVAWQDGAWNEWFMVAGDSAGWLADAQGFLSVAFAQPMDQVPDLVAGALPAFGDTLTIAGRPFRVTDVKDAVCVGSEGELPFRAAIGRRATYLDMVDPTGGFASIEATTDGVELYRGEYVRFDALGLRNLRALDGWAPPANRSAPDDPLA